MDFTFPPALAELRGQVRRYVDERVIPVEDEIIAQDAAGRHDTLRALQAEVKGLGLWAPHLPVAHGGLGLGVMGMCALFREMGRSMVGPRVFHCDAPDQGNMDLLIQVADQAIQDRWLKPLCAGEITSAFCMTEPAPGAGADPTNLRTRAERDGEGWVIRGHKWYTTGGRDASFLLVMARTSDDPLSGATLFVVDRHAPGVTYLRDIPVMAEPLLAHREGELRFEGVRVGPEAILGGEGWGFALAQQRLVPARLTHCMRWLGLADRALQLSRDHLNRRVSFGKRLGEHQLVQLKLAEGAMAVHAGDLMTLRCAWMLEQGLDHQEVKVWSSMAKTQVAQALCKVLDDAIQTHGGLGYSDDVPFARWYRYARAARIADGPDEVHLVTIARALLKGRLQLLT
jgi:acyl-CoA dehydrogenase